MMKGWKTWVAVIGGVALGIFHITQGDIVDGIKCITAAVAAYGIGHKVEKNASDGGLK